MAIFPYSTQTQKGARIHASIVIKTSSTLVVFYDRANGCLIETEKFVVEARHTEARNFHDKYFKQNTTIKDAVC